VEDYALGLTAMMATLATLGEVVEESRAVEKMLRSMPLRFKQIVISIRTLLDTSTLTVADVTGRLKAAEESFEPPPTLQHDGKLYLTKEEWDARRRRCEAENQAGGGASGSSGRRGNRRGRGRGRGGDSALSSSIGPTNFSGKVGKDQCRRCGKVGL
jgi:hypothetical protein